MVTVMFPSTGVNADELVALSEMLEDGAPKLKGQGGREMTLPEPLYSLLKATVKGLRAGQPVRAIGGEEQLTTQLAAQILGCSRPHVVKLMEAGEIPYEMAGTHRRVRYGVLLAFRERVRARREAWDAVVREAVHEGHYVGMPLEEGQSDE